jgi:hypothetical protein
MILEGLVKGYFKSEAQFLLMWLLGLPFILIVLSLAVSLYLGRRHG